MNVRVEETQRGDRSMKRTDPISRIGRPKALFILAAGLSFVLSVSLFFTGSQEQGIYVGIWVPSILSAGALLLGGNGHE